MKKNYLFFLLPLFAFVTVTHAQLLTPFKAKDGQAYASEQVKTAGYTHPELIMLGSMNGQPPGVPIELKFNTDNGTSNAWLYMFRSADKTDSLRALAVTKLPILGYKALEFSPGQILSQLPITGTASLEGKTWMDSDLMIDKLRQNEVYKLFIKDFPGAIVKFVGLGVNTDNPLMEKDKAYWMLIVQQGDNGEPMTCQINGESGEVFCHYIGASVEGDKVNPGLSLYPQPACDNIYINIPRQIQASGSRLELRDTFGSLVKSLVAPTFGEAEQVSVSTSGLAAGLYFIRYGSQSFSSTIPVIISK